MCCRWRCSSGSLAVPQHSQHGRITFIWFHVKIWFVLMVHPFFLTMAVAFAGPIWLVLLRFFLFLLECPTFKNVKQCDFPEALCRQVQKLDQES
jgi:hypothetical protein